MNNLKGKTALVTGATSGIGEAIAKMLAQMGVNVILHGRNKDRLLSLQESLQRDYNSIDIIDFDIRDKEETLSKIKELLKSKEIDILINSAGLAVGLDRFDEGDIEDWEEMIDANVKGLLYITRSILPQMRKRDKGHIVNLGSIAGIMAYPKGNVYCATKAAVGMLSDALNADLLGTNIRVSCVEPGAVETNFSNVRFKGDTKKAKKVYEGYKPLSAEDVAYLVIYILNVPDHVNIQHALIMPTAQRNPYLLHRENKEKK
ncbi:MAG: SDR family NAD(P)-dependent oxidoreductase [Epsilonproteobacteria bacterium]|nr:SDR family NAD(P)-dependent oxidoreductase [Campylobacterota bacterium]